VIPPWASAWVALASVVAFAAMAFDKIRARRRAARVPERVLLALALAGGSPGVAVGMVVLRHKTRKMSFVTALLGVVALQGALLLALDAI